MHQNSVSVTFNCCFFPHQAQVWAADISDSFHVTQCFKVSVRETDIYLEVCRTRPKLPTERLAMFFCKVKRVVRHADITCRLMFSPRSRDVIWQVIIWSDPGEIRGTRDRVTQRIDQSDWLFLSVIIRHSGWNKHDVDDLLNRQSSGVGFSSLCLTWTADRMNTIFVMSAK